MLKATHSLSLSSSLPLVVHQLGVADYRTVLALQLKLFDKVVAKTKAVTEIQFQAAKRGDKNVSLPPIHDEETPVHVIVCEHGPVGVHTMGKREKLSDIRPSASSSSLPEDFSKSLVPTGRGGGLTYHGPGQLMLYPVAHIPSLRKNCPPSAMLAASKQGAMHFYTALLEATMMETLEHFGVKKSFPANTGVWVPNANEGVELPKSRTDAPTNASKIGFIGLELKQMCSMHGLCLNVRRECLDHFEPIVICEMEKATATCLEDCCCPKMRGVDVLKDVAPVVLEKFCVLSGLQGGLTRC